MNFALVINTDCYERKVNDFADGCTEHVMHKGRAAY